MKPPGIPPEENDRLFALYRTGLVDSPVSESFDRITRMAAKALDVPIALVSLVAEERQWFKSRFGLDAAQTPRDISFCGHAVEQRCPLIIADALLDPRFADNPLVTGVPHIRAYAGMPIFTADGYAIGTLCAIDRRPRHFSDDEINWLRDYALIIEDLLHAKERIDLGTDLLRNLGEREAVFREAFELAAIGIVHVSLSGHLLRANQYFTNLLGYDERDFDQLSLAGLTHPDDIHSTSTLMHQISATVIDSFRIEKRLQRKDGEYVWISLSVALKKSSSGRPEYLIGVIEDIDERKLADIELIRIRDSLQAEVAQQTQKIVDTNDTLRGYVKRLLESERTVRQVQQRLQTIADNIPVLIGYWNRQLRCEFANEAYRGAFGLEPDEIVGMDMPSLVGADAFEELRPHTRLVLLGNPQRFERTRTRADGAQFISEVRYMPDFNEFGQVQGFVTQATDITSARNVQQALETAHARLLDNSETDYLTGLANRATFTQKSEEAVADLRSRGQSFGLLLLDIDHFKQINDAFGHDVGDGVLCAVGDLLKAHRGDNRDIIARLLEDEFAMLCVGEFDEGALRELGERIRVKVRDEAMQFESGLVRYTMSCGITRTQPHEETMRTIHSRAKAALLEAKAAGRDTLVYKA